MPRARFRPDREPVREDPKPPRRPRLTEAPGAVRLTQEARRARRQRTSTPTASLRSPESIQADLRAGRLTMGHARALLSLASAADQLSSGRDPRAFLVGRATEEDVQRKRSQLPRRPPSRPAGARYTLGEASHACVWSATSAADASRSPHLARRPDRSPASRRRGAEAGRRSWAIARRGMSGGVDLRRRGPPRGAGA